MDLTAQKTAAITLLPPLWAVAAGEHCPFWCVQIPEITHTVFVIRALGRASATMAIMHHLGVRVPRSRVITRLGNDPHVNEITGLLE